MGELEYMHSNTQCTGIQSSLRLVKISRGTNDIITLVSG